jgi:hypothetical protein
METRNKHASQEVPQSKGLPEKQAAGFGHPQKFLASHQVNEAGSKRKQG